MVKAYLSLGSNLGDRWKNLNDAIIRIDELIGKIKASSSFYQTEPWGFKSENLFLNMVLCVETDLSPSGLLERILMIESMLGRKREDKQFSSREIDIDMLIFDEQIVEDIILKIPHPMMHLRKFVMVPLCEIAPEEIHPVFKKSFFELLKTCPDKSRVALYHEES